MLGSERWQSCGTSGRHCLWWQYAGGAQSNSCWTCMCCTRQWQLVACFACFCTPLKPFSSSQESALPGNSLSSCTGDACSGAWAAGQQPSQHALVALLVTKLACAPSASTSVCSCRARQGKSFILNQLLQVTGGFQIGSTTRPCTKGLWMWSTPQKRVDEDGKEYHIVRRWQQLLQALQL